MSENKNNTQLKYNCNHPASDFIDNSKGPIYMKEENFVEYTRRNEKPNNQTGSWNNVTPYSSNAGNYTNTQYSSRNKKKKSSSAVFWIIFIFYFLPLIFEALSELFEELN